MRGRIDALCMCGWRFGGDRIGKRSEKGTTEAARANESDLRCWWLQRCAETRRTRRKRKRNQELSTINHSRQVSHEYTFALMCVEWICTVNRRSVSEGKAAAQAMRCVGRSQGGGRQE